MSDEATTEETAEETEKKSPPKPRSKKRPVKKKGAGAPKTKPAAKKATAKKKAPAKKAAAKKRVAKKPSSGSASKPGFVGFEEPPRVPKPDGATWKTKLPVLDEHYKGQWVKYGPFDSAKVKTSITTLEKNATNLDLNVEHESRVEPEGAFLYVRVV